MRKRSRSTLVRIVHDFSFPLRCFEFHHLRPAWQEFLDDFQGHRPTHDDIYERLTKVLIAITVVLVVLTRP